MSQSRSVSIAKALKAAGYDVAANYGGGNDEAAAKFKAETGIPVYKAFCCSTTFTPQPGNSFEIFDGDRQR